jgi:hypothetical protein
MKRLLLLIAVLLTGCWRMTVRNGNPVGETPIDFDNKWHSGVVYGLAELTGPYDVSKVCPRGWAEIHTETPFPQGLVQVLTFNLYNPQGVTIRCAAR